MGKYILVIMGGLPVQTVSRDSNRLLRSLSILLEERKETRRNKRRKISKNNEINEWLWQPSAVVLEILS
jgi:hypothetical protein